MSGKTGHKQTECLYREGGKAAVTASSSGEQPPDTSGNVRFIVTGHLWTSMGQLDDVGSWVFAANSKGTNSVILFDSGSDEHVCDISFAPEAPTKKHRECGVQRATCSPVLTSET